MLFEEHVLWVKDGCPSCSLLRMKLTRSNIPFREVNISEKGQYIDYFKYKGWNRTPKLTLNGVEVPFTLKIDGKVSLDKDG